MKLILVTSLLIVLQSCISFYDSLEYYIDGYQPNNSALPTNGFYYSKSDSTVHGAWPNAIQEIYFFKDGSFELGSNYEHIDSLDRWLCKFGEKNYTDGPFGFYTIKNDTILVEYIVADSPGFTKAERYDFKALMTKNGIRIIEQNGEATDQEWLFHENACVPESIENWLRKHRMYKLKTVTKNN